MARTNLHINVFPGIQNLPHYAAIRQGYYEAGGISVATSYTKSSEEQRAGLAAGNFDIAHAALDNAVAMVDVANEDVVVVVGLDPSFNRLVVRSDIQSCEDLIGKTFGVDAPDTAFALVAYEFLARKGLPRGSYSVQPIGATRFRLEALQQGRIDAALLNLPFNLMARESGLRLLEDPLATIGPYQSVGGFVRRAWARMNEAALVAYLGAYIRGVRWTLDPRNRAAAARLASEEMRFSPEMAAECVNIVTAPGSGFSVDAMLSQAGMRNVLRLRAEFVGAAAPEPISRYYEDCYYAAALRSLQ